MDWLRFSIGFVIGVLLWRLVHWMFRCRHPHPHTERNALGRLELVCACGWRKPFNLQTEYVKAKPKERVG